MNNNQTKLPRNVLCALYKSTLLPVIEYYDIIFDNYKVRAALAIENAQRRDALAYVQVHISTPALIVYCLNLIGYHYAKGVPPTNLSCYARSFTG